MDLLGLLPGFGNLFFTLGAFVVALSVIVAVHEYGHYIVGRWSGIHAEVFSIGFGPVLFSRTDRRGTRWQVAALPFGGYVKFLGDSNAASGADSTAMAKMDGDQRRHTMHGAPLWARSATVTALRMGLSGSCCWGYEREERRHADCLSCMAALPIGEASSASS